MSYDNMSYLNENGSERMENILAENDKRISSSAHSDNITPIPSVDLQMSQQQRNFVHSTPENDEKLIPAITGAEISTTATNNESHQRLKIWRTSVVKKWPIMSEPLALLFIFLLLWAAGYSLLPKYFEPNSSIMNLTFLFIGAQISGISVQLFHLPDMLGMLFFGILFTNLKENLFDDSLSYGLQAVCRQIALVNIMLLVGLGLDFRALKNFLGMVVRLTIIPAVAEILIIAVLAKVFLFLPYMWGVLMGLVITAVSPNVIVSVMLELQKKNLGTLRGIHTIVYGMTATGDIFAILIFRILLSVIFSSEPTEKLILKNVLGIGIGIAYGVIFGFVLIYFPHHNAEYKNALRFLLITLGGIVAVVGTEAINCPSGGVLGCIILAFIAGEGWRNRKTNGEDTEPNNTGQYLQLMWSFFKPISFSLIGIEVKFSGADPKVYGFGVIIIILGVLLRLSFSYLSMYGKYLTWKERAYITVCGLPKATIQAALGPLALDTARDILESDTEQLPDSKYETYAKIILVTSVLAIVLTAPLGAVLMIRLAPKWLKRTSEEQLPPPVSLENTITKNTIIRDSTIE